MTKYMMVIKKETFQKERTVSYLEWLKRAAEGKYEGYVYSITDFQFLPFKTNNDIFIVRPDGYTIDKEAAISELNRISVDGEYKEDFEEMYISNAIKNKLSAFASVVDNTLVRLHSIVEAKEGVNVISDVYAAADKIYGAVESLTEIRGPDGLISAAFYNMLHRVYNSMNYFFGRSDERKYYFTIIEFGVRFAAFVDSLLNSTDTGFFVPYVPPARLNTPFTPESCLIRASEMKTTIGLVMDSLNENEMYEKYQRIFDCSHLSYEKFHLLDAERMLSDLEAMIVEPTRFEPLEPSKELLEQLERLLLSHVVDYVQEYDSLKPSTEADEAILAKIKRYKTNEGFANYCLNYLNLIRSV